MAPAQEKHDAARQDIGGLIATLASRPQVNKGRRKLTCGRLASVAISPPMSWRAASCFSCADAMV